MSETRHVYLIQEMALGEVAVDYDMGGEVADVSIEGKAVICLLTISGKGMRRHFTDHATVRVSIRDRVYIAKDGSIDVTALKAEAVRQLKAMAESYGDHEAELA